MAVYDQKSADLIEHNLARHGFGAVAVTVSEFGESFRLDYIMDDYPSEDLYLRVNAFLGDVYNSVKFIWTNLFPQNYLA